MNMPAAVLSLFAKECRRPADSKRVPCMQVGKLPFYH